MKAFIYQLIFIIVALAMIVGLLLASVNALSEDRFLGKREVFLLGHSITGEFYICRDKHYHVDFRVDDFDKFMQAVNDTCE
jgi:hypothetical protein